MQKKRPISAYTFTILIAVTAAIISYQSLYHQNIYAANPPYLRALLIGRDSVTLCIGVPLLLITGFMVFQKSNRAYLSWMGVLGYFWTTYLWYACGIVYNRFFLIYLTLFAISLFSFIRAMLAVDAEIFCLRFSAKTPVQLIAVFMFLSALVLAYQWLNWTLPGLGFGNRPDLLRLYGPAMMINPVLNLGIISPVAVISGIWIWKRKPWGYLLSSIILLYGLISNLALLATQWIIYNRGEEIDGKNTILFGIIILGSLILWCVFLKNLREEKIQDYHNQISSLS